MRPTRATDARFIQAPPDRIFALLLAVDGYAAWWPADIGVDVLSPQPHGVGSVVAVRLAKTGGGFRCRIASADPPRAVAVDYIEGAHRGRGLWTLEPRDGGTQVTYGVDLKPRGLMVGLLSLVMDFSALHSRLMGEVLEGLERAASKEKAAKPELRRLDPDGRAS